jgi:hypothetical protein
MSQLLQLAECYYAAARDLAWKAQEFQKIASFLEDQATALCEQNMREQPMPEVTPSPQSTVTGAPCTKT